MAGPETPLDGVVPALAALELLHAFAVVQDDVMDDWATWRRRPTAHRVLAGQQAAAGRCGDLDRFGEAAAVLVGDLCLVWADRLLGAAALLLERALRVTRYTARQDGESRVLFGYGWPGWTGPIR